MHTTSYLKAAAFAKAYVQPHSMNNESTRVLDVGSKSYLHQRSYKNIFARGRIEYVGLDLEPGLNVDLLPKDPFVWSEIADEAFDFVVSGQTFEHNPFFWITFAEMARVLRQGGLLLIIAPGRGRVHRYPVDCWRFYPDAWMALSNYCGLALVESNFEDYEQIGRVEDGAEWCDSSVVARKPSFSDTAGCFSLLRATPAHCVNPADDDFPGHIERHRQRPS